MAAQSMANKLGLSFTHNRLRVSKLKEAVSFYTQRFGMKCIAKLQIAATKEDAYILGFTGTEGSKMDKNVAFLELTSPMEEMPAAKHRNYGSHDSVYWKVGFCFPDIDKVYSALVKEGVRVTQPKQLRDIGYLCHLQDPAGFSMELLQFYFEGNTQPYPEHPSNPLGQHPVFGMVTLRVKDANASLKFYRDTLGMRLICTEDISVFGFHLYFLAFTDETPPNAADLGAVENREWTYQRPYTVLELQAHVDPSDGVKYTDMDNNCYGFLGLGFGTNNVQEARTHFSQQGLKPTDISTDLVLDTPCFSVRDPDGTPIRIAQF